MESNQMFSDLQELDGMKFLLHMTQRSQSIRGRLEATQTSLSEGTLTFAVLLDAIAYTFSEVRALRQEIETLRQEIVEDYDFENERA